MENLVKENIICIDVRSHNMIQLFAVCIKYSVDMDVLTWYKRKSVDISSNLTGKIWIDIITKNRVAVEYTIHWDTGSGYMMYCNKRKKTRVSNSEDYMFVGHELDLLNSIKPVKTPKLPKTEEVIDKYIYYVEHGCVELRNPEMDAKVAARGYIINTYLSDMIDGKPFEPKSKPSKKSTSVNIEDLKKKMNEAVLNEDYELAASLRDKIKELS